jgi:hypothetical protein
VARAAAGEEAPRFLSVIGGDQTPPLLRSELTGGDQQRVFWMKLHGPMGLTSDSYRLTRLPTSRPEKSSTAYCERGFGNFLLGRYDEALAVEDFLGLPSGASPRAPQPMRC